MEINSRIEFGCRPSLPLVYPEIYALFRFSHELTLYGRLNLVNTSSAHASSVVVHYLLPTYTAFVAVNEWTVLQPNAAVTVAGGVDLTVKL